MLELIDFFKNFEHVYVNIEINFFLSTHRNKLYPSWMGFLYISNLMQEKINNKRENSKELWHIASDHHILL